MLIPLLIAALLVVSATGKSFDTVSFTDTRTRTDQIWDSDPLIGKFAPRWLVEGNQIACQPWAATTWDGLVSDGAKLPPPAEFDAIKAKRCLGAQGWIYARRFTPDENTLELSNGQVVIIYALYFPRSTKTSGEVVLNQWYYIFTILPNTSAAHPSQVSYSKNFGQTFDYNGSGADLVHPIFSWDEGSATLVQHPPGTPSAATGLVAWDDLNVFERASLSAWPFNDFSNLDGGTNMVLTDFEMSWAVHTFYPLDSDLPLPPWPAKGD
ncbi:hypothetical protein MRB53_040895 [Persea americana]|nr:hypothetical protein MRB53_040895 [Persea americana]